MVLVNYRGSTGYGDKALLSLPGKVGQQDVADCMTALDSVLDKFVLRNAQYKPDLNKSDFPVVVFGGSHGGFLAAHLCGQHGDRFRCAILRNPVTNISLMSGTSDIPDWCYVEVFGCEEGMNRFSFAPTPDDLKGMYNASPIAHVEKYKVPSLFLIGEKDQRVPMTNPLQFIAKLQSQGVETKVIRFPKDCHPLSRPQTEFLAAVQTMEWIHKFCDVPRDWQY